MGFTQGKSMKEASGSSVEPVFSSAARAQATCVSGGCRSNVRNQRAAVGTALSLGLGKGEAMEGRRTKILCDD